MLTYTWCALSWRRRSLKARWRWNWRRGTCWSGCAAHCRRSRHILSWAGRKSTSKSRERESEDLYNSQIYKQSYKKISTMKWMTKLFTAIKRNRKQRRWLRYTWLLSMTDTWIGFRGCCKLYSCSRIIAIIIHYYVFNLIKV